jgi:type VI secretion system protein ImpB
MSRLGSSQLRNKRDRPTRVDVTYTLHLPDGTQRQERLPFVIGVIADLKGDLKDEPSPEDAEKSQASGLADRTRDFRHIHKDNFDEILAYSKPYLKFAVADVLRGQGLLQVELDFKALDDFHPDQIVRNVPQLVAERERRKRLEVLLGMLGSDPRLEERLQEIVDNPAKRSEFLAEMARRETGGNPG